VDIKIAHFMDILLSGLNLKDNGGREMKNVIHYIAQDGSEKTETIENETGLDKSEAAKELEKSGIKYQHIISVDQYN